MTAGDPRALTARWAPWVLLSAFLFQLFLSAGLEDRVHPVPFDPNGGVFNRGVASTLRAVAFLSGRKVLAGHAFWIKVIQYYGDADNSADRYSKLFDYCSLASDLNPRFIAPYTFGAAALAFHLKRIDQAEKLLQKGILSNPKETRLKLMYAAIAFQNTEEYEKVIPFLEQQILRGDAPLMLINILANTYEKVGRFQDAVKLWQKILRDGDTNEERIIAAKNLQKLYVLMSEKDRSKPSPAPRQQANSY